MQRATAEHAEIAVSTKDFSLRSRWSRRLMCVFLCFAGCSSPQTRRSPPLDDGAIALNNRGVGLMGQFDYQQAHDVFARLAAAHPERPDLQVNLAIALLNRQQEGDAAEAHRILERVLAVDPQQLRAHYCLGLLLLNEGRVGEALPHFVFVTERDPGDAHALYYVAQCRFQQGDFAGALASYERALRVNPHLRSAAYGAFQASQRLGRPDAPRMLDLFRALETNPQSEVVELKYTRMGRLAEAATIDEPARQRAARPAGPVFDPAPAPLIAASERPIAWRRLNPPPASITAADIDGDGQIDLFIAGAIDDHGATRNAVLINHGAAGFVLDVAHPLAAIPAVNAALWGDYDNDGLTDVYLCRRGSNQLWRQTEKGRWSNVTVAARADGGGGTTIDGAMFDADHDGDLDVLVIKSDGANELLNNNGDGTFRPIGAQIGLAGDRRASTGLLVADLDSDRDADLIVLRESPPHDVLINDRTWRYHRDPAFDTFAGTPMAAAVAGDLDADGRPELYSSGPDGIQRWSRSASGTWEPRLVSGTQSLAGAAQLALADVDGDGRLDLVATGSDGRWQAVAISDAGDATPVFAEQGSPVAGWSIVVLDAAHGPSMVAVPREANGAPVVWKPGTGRFQYVAMALSGRDRNSTQLRSNASGIGAQIAARADSHWTALSSYRSQSGAGQSLQPLAVGLGGSPQLDFVAITWPDGVFQSELALAPGSVRRIEETQRQLSSCPVLFAFDGRHFAFVTDLLGVGGIGTPTSPGVFDPPHPSENILLPDGLLAARQGRYELKITEPMEEVAYVDAARLVAYDLPPGWQLVLDERKAISAPDATGEPRFYRDERLPVRATLGARLSNGSRAPSSRASRGTTCKFRPFFAGGAGLLGACSHFSDTLLEEGEDVTRAVTSADGVAGPAGRVDPRFIGRTDDHTLTLRFDRALDAGDGDPMLVADGWIEYPYAQTLFAAWQARAEYLAPTIEARGAGGQWHLLRREFGYPAGMPRRMSVPLGRLPRGTKEIRLRTTQEIYWDRLAIAYAAPSPLVERHVLALTSARLAYGGFARREMHAGRRPSYDYDRRAPLWDTRYSRGRYTAEGPVTDLLSTEDGAVAIFGPGEELHLMFAASLAAPKAGWTRRFVLEARGWCKDMDLYTKDGDTVEPVPGTRAAAAADLQRRYTTRYESGR
jgi:Tfp pilus assembly protein PilF